MQITSYITNDIPLPAPQDVMKKVFNYFEKHTYTHMPLVSKNKLLGNIAEADLQGYNESSRIEDYMYSFDTFSVRDTTNWINVLEIFSKNETNIMPVLDEGGNYLGYYDLVDIMILFRKTPFLTESGGILIVEKGIKDYSFSEISQIVESNDGKLLGSFISETREDIIQITLKIGNTGLNDIIQTFRRYGYTIVYGNERDTYMENLKDRSEYLDKYLNI